MHVHLGVQCGDICIPILMYADNIVLLAECEEDLQTLLNTLNDRCSKWGAAIQ